MRDEVLRIRGTRGKDAGETAVHPGVCTPKPTGLPVALRTNGTGSKGSAALLCSRLITAYCDTKSWKADELFKKTRYCSAKRMVKPSRNHLLTRQKLSVERKNTVTYVKKRDLQHSCKLVKNYYRVAVKIGCVIRIECERKSLDIKLSIRILVLWFGLFGKKIRNDVRNDVKYRYAVKIECYQNRILKINQ